MLDIWGVVVVVWAAWKVMCMDRAVMSSVDVSAKKIRSALSRLPRREQSVLALYAFDFSVDDIAHALGISHSKVRKVLHRVCSPETVAVDQWRKHGIATMLQVIAFEALSSITRDDLLSLPPKTRLEIAAQCVSAMQKLGATSPTISRSEHDIIEELKIKPDEHNDNQPEPTTATA